MSKCCFPEDEPLYTHICICTNVQASTSRVYHLKDRWLTGMVWGNITQEMLCATEVLGQFCPSILDLICIRIPIYTLRNIVTFWSCAWNWKHCRIREAGKTAGKDTLKGPDENSEAWEGAGLKYSAVSCTHPVILPPVGSTAGEAVYGITGAWAAGNKAESTAEGKGRWKG